MSTVKEEVQRLVETLPDDATWDTVMYEIYVRQKIVAGEEAIAEGRVRRHADVKKLLVRRPDPSRWDLQRLATTGKEEDLALAKQGLGEWAGALEGEDHLR